MQTLPEKEFKSKLAEILKCGILDDPELFKTLETSVGEIEKRNMDLGGEVVVKFCQIKKGSWK